MRESEVQKSIQAALAIRGRLVKISTTGIPDGTRAREGRFRANPTPGVADLLGVLRFPCPVCRVPIGRFVAVECKAPGRGPSPKQVEFLGAMRREGGLAVVADSAERAISALEGQVAEELELRPIQDRRARISVLMWELVSRAISAGLEPRELASLVDVVDRLLELFELPKERPESLEAALAVRQKRKPGRKEGKD